MTRPGAESHEIPGLSADLFERRVLGFLKSMYNGEGGVSSLLWGQISGHTTRSVT
jgi:hypothetical protein